MSYAEIRETNPAGPVKAESERDGTAMKGSSYSTMNNLPGEGQVPEKHAGARTGKGESSIRLAFLTAALLLLTASVSLALGTFPPGDIWFPPLDRADLKLKALMDSATMEIKCAFYDIKNATIGQAILDARNRGILVKVVTDADNAGSASYVDEFEAAGIEVKQDTGTGLMHNKFVIVDNRYVWTGSYNVTDNGTFRNNNNAILIDDVMLANNFRVEFDEMFNDEQFGAGSPANTPNPVLSVNGVTVETYFSPDDGVTAKIVAEIEKATSFVYFEAFSFTSDPIYTALKARHDAGVYVKGIFETQQDAAASKYSKYRPLKRVGADVILDTNPNNMHNKTFIIDGNTVITGSFNFSASAEEKNDENILILRNTDVAARYSTEFQRLFTLFTQGESVRGFVKNSSTGTLISGATITNTTTGSVTASDELGWYRFLNVNSVNYVVRAECEGYFAYEATLAEPVERHDIALQQIADYGNLKGTVVEASGKALEGVAVQITHTSSAGVKTYLSTLTDSTGQFAISRAPAYMSTQDAILVTLTCQGYITVSLPNKQVPKNGTLDLGSLAMTTNFQIGGFMNPVMEEYAIVTVKDNSGSTTLPVVRVTQNNYVPVDLTMTRISKTGMFTGPFKIVPGYTGRAEIDVNSGQGRGYLQVFLLEARTGTTVEASGKISVVFASDSLDGSLTGIMARDTDAEEELASLPGAVLRSQAMAVTPSVRLLGQGASVTMMPSEDQSVSPQASARVAAGSKLWLMHRSAGLGWQALESRELVSGAVTGQCMETGAWCLVEDNAAPALTQASTEPELSSDGTQIFRISLSDPLSGVDWTSVRATLGGRELTVQTQPEQKSLLVLCDADTLSAVQETGADLEIDLSCSDQSGNQSSLKVAAQALSSELLTSVLAWPSPVRRGEKLTFRYTLAEQATIRIHIYDNAGDRIASPINDDRNAGLNDTDVWDLTDSRGVSVPNGTYFFTVEARGSSGRLQRRTGKFALLR